MSTCIKFAKQIDLDRVIQFLEKNWNKNHIFVTNPEIMRYYHFFNNEFRYVIAEDINSRQILGVCGFIQYNETKNPDVVIALWKTIKSSDSMLGIKMIEWLKKETCCRSFSCCGIIPKVKPIYQFLGYTTGELNHYYRLRNQKDYKIAIVKNKRILPIQKVDREAFFIRYESFEEMDTNYDWESSSKHIPFKDKSYIKYRYFEHPVYNYEVYGINLKKGKTHSVFVGRSIKQFGRKVFRMVDFIGNEMILSNAGNAVQLLLEENQYEYIDFYNIGISREILEKAGFLLREKKDENIIPNYFEPFVQENVTIHFMTNQIENFMMCKADGDQDRPNLII